MSQLFFPFAEMSKPCFRRFISECLFHRGESRVILEIFISRGGNCIKEVGFILFFRFYITLGNTSAQPTVSLAYFTVSFTGQSVPQLPTSLYDRRKIWKYLRCLAHLCRKFLYRAVRQRMLRYEDRDVRHKACSVSSYSVPGPDISIRLLLFLQLHVPSIRDDTFCTSVHWSNMGCLLSVPTFQCTRSATVEHAKYVISESFS